MEGGESPHEGSTGSNRGGGRVGVGGWMVDDWGGGRSTSTRDSF